MSTRPAGCGEDVAAYALGALDDVQAHRFERHLAECELCRADLATLTPVVQTLPATAEPVDPPPELKKRIMAVVEAEASERRAAERGPRRSWLPSFRWAPALAAGACALVLAAVLVTRGGGDDAETFTASVAPQGAAAEMTVADDGGTLKVEGMPAPPNGRVYQVWTQHGNEAPEPTSALFTPRGDGTASVAVTGDMDDVDRVLVSDEPQGGSERPSSAAHIVIES